MKRQSFISTLSLWSWISLALLPFSPSAAEPRLLPAFRLSDLEGKMHSQEEWKGKVVLIDFWATWCAPCRENIPALSQLQKKYGPQGLIVVGVSLDKGKSEKIAKFARNLKANYLILHDPDDTMSKAFGFDALPSVYLFGRQRELVKAMPNYTAMQEKLLEALVAEQATGMVEEPVAVKTEEVIPPARGNIEGKSAKKPRGCARYNGSASHRRSDVLRIIFF